MIDADHVDFSSLVSNATARSKTEFETNKLRHKQQFSYINMIYRNKLSKVIFNIVIRNQNT